MSDPDSNPAAADSTAADRDLRRTAAVGFYLLAVFLPLGLTLEALHALKVDVYLESTTRREMWTLAHAHGGVLGLLCLVFSNSAERWLTAERRGSIARQIRWGALLMPLGFLLAGVGNHEGDPSLGILLVPVGGALLLVALVRAGIGCKLA